MARLSQDREGLLPSLPRGWQGPKLLGRPLLFPPGHGAGRLGALDMGQPGQELAPRRDGYRYVGLSYQSCHSASLLPLLMEPLEGSLACSGKGSKSLDHRCQSLQLPDTIRYALRQQASATRTAGERTQGQDGKYRGQGAPGARKEAGQRFGTNTTRPAVGDKGCTASATWVKEAMTCGPGCTEVGCPLHHQGTAE